MGFWEHFPYTNFHNINLNWILGEIKKIPDIVRVEVDKLSSVKLVEDITLYGAVKERDCTDAVRAAVVASYASGNPVYVPKGNYLVNKDNAFPYSTRFVGPGTLEWGGAKYNLWGYNFINETGGEYSVSVVENNVNNPGHYDQNLHGNIAKSIVYDGGQNSTGDDRDRTAYMVANLNMQHRGDGDAGCVNLSGYMTKSGDSDAHFIPALILANGQAITFAKDTYLNPFEFNLHDNGHEDVRAVGFVLNMFKDGDTTNGDRYWSGFRIQNKGLKELPVAYQAIGGDKPIVVAFDASQSGGECALALRSDQRIFFCYDPSDNVPGRFTERASMGVVNNQYYVIGIGDAQMVLDKTGRMDCPPNVTLDVLYPTTETSSVGAETNKFNSVYARYFVDDNGSLRFNITENRTLIDNLTQLHDDDVTSLNAEIAALKTRVEALENA